MFVTGPAFPSRCDVLLLPFLCAPTNENHNALAILAEVDALAGAEVDLVFKDAGTHALDVREIPLLHPRERDSHLGGCRRVELFQPRGEAFVSVFIDVAAKLDRHRGSW
jgi:hypothetical protein